jgi:hypothetical protein
VALGDAQLQRGPAQPCRGHATCRSFSALIRPPTFILPPAQGAESNPWASALLLCLRLLTSSPGSTLHPCRRMATRCAEVLYSRLGCAYVCAVEPVATLGGFDVAAAAAQQQQAEAEQESGGGGSKDKKKKKKKKVRGGWRGVAFVSCSAWANVQVASLEPLQMAASNLGHHVRSSAPACRAARRCQAAAPEEHCQQQGPVAARARHLSKCHPAFMHLERLAKCCCCCCCCGAAAEGQDAPFHAGQP